MQSNRSAIETVNTDVRQLVADFRVEVDAAMKANKVEADKVLENMKSAISVAYDDQEMKKTRPDPGPKQRRLHA